MTMLYIRHKDFHVLQGISILFFLSPREQLLGVQKHLQQILSDDWYGYFNEVCVFLWILRLDTMLQICVSQIYIYIFFHVVFSFLKQGLRQAGTREDLLDQTLYFKQSQSFSGAIHALSRWIEAICANAQ